LLHGTVHGIYITHTRSVKGLKLRIMQYLIQQIAQSVIHNHLSLMFILHVSTSTRSSSGRYTHIQSHTSTANSVRDVHV